MDQYLKRKIIQPKKQQQKPLNQNEQIIKQLRQKLDQVFKQIEYSRVKLQDIKLVASQVEIRLYPKSDACSTILVETPLQKSSIKTELFNGQTQKPINFIQQPFRLETTQVMADQRNTLLANRIDDQHVIGELPQSSKGARRGRKAIKKI